MLEAGPEDNLWIHIPIGYGKTMFHPVYNWGFSTNPDPGMNDVRVLAARPRPATARRSMA
jgi:choline dehydrogenase